MINKAISRVLIVCLCAFFSANSTFAQGVIEEIVVSAQKRDESIQDVPFTITALTGEKLDQLNVQDFADYARSIPSLDFRTWVRPVHAVSVLRQSGESTVVKGPIPLLFILMIRLFPSLTRAFLILTALKC